MKQAIVILLLIFLSGCAARKTKTDITKTTEKDKVEQTQSGKVESKSETKSSESIVDQKDKEKVETTTKVNEVLNPDGSVKERTTTTSNKKSTDKSTKTTKRTLEIKTSFIHTYKIRYTREITKVVKIKAKSTSTNNYGWIAFVSLALYFIYLKFRK